MDSQTPSLVVLNARGFDAGQATYEFVILDAAGTRVVQDFKDVAAGNGQTEERCPRPSSGTGLPVEGGRHAGDARPNRSRSRWRWP